MKIKRYVSLILALGMALSLTACSSPEPTEPAPSEPKTASATMQGFGGDVTVTLSVEGDKLSDVQIVGDKETLTVGRVAVDILSERMMEENKVSVDKVSGATITSSVAIAAAKEALESIGVSEDTLAPGVESPAINTDTVTTDVIVVGGGGAGIAAAMAAVDEGKSVVLLEKMGILGGDTALSGGVRIRAKVEGDPEDTMTEDDLYDFYMEKTNYLSDPDVIRTYADNVTDAMEWANNMGPGVGELTRYRTTPENIMALQPLEGGTGLINTMKQGLEESGAEIYLNTPAQELIMEDGIIVGVKAMRENGQIQEFRANGGVVLACGGFGSNPEMLEKYSTPGADKVVSLCAKGGTGDGITMGEKVGAAIRFSEDWDNNGTNSELSNEYYIAFPQTDAMLVNDKGMRFIREDEQRPHIYKAMRLQLAEEVEGLWFVFDSNTIGEGVDAFIEKGSAVKADTIEELAEQMGVDQANLVATAERYDSFAGQEDPDFNKPSEFMKGLSEGPFYAVKTWPLRTTTVGGLVINNKTEVLDNNDQPIPHLFAAGEVANYTFFNSNNPTCGSAVSSAIVFGRIAGTAAAQLAD